ncbi:MAG TPA: hypothetical protein VGH09_12480 [Solirubrobacteraceae bacterium]|jgi:hypothetical protein
MDDRDREQAARIWEEEEPVVLAAIQDLVEQGDYGTLRALHAHALQVRAAHEEQSELALQQVQSKIANLHARIDELKGSSRGA